MELLNNPQQAGRNISALRASAVVGRRAGNQTAALPTRAANASLVVPARTPNIAFLSTYPPQQCGIATFTEDLAQAIGSVAAGAGMGIIAVGEDIESVDFPDEVVHRISRHDRASYAAAANYINTSSYDAVSVQHEFGIFGGSEGGHLLDFLYAVRKPVITTLHTVLSNPSEEYRNRTIDVVSASDGVIVMTPKAIDILRDVYGIPPSRVSYVPHGIPDVEYANADDHKGRFGVEGRTVIMTFGLIGPSKGIEQMIEALPAITADHPEVLYMVVGATHPGVVRHEGERYRDTLVARAGELGVSDNVVFHNRYLSDDEVCDYLKACDIYVTPYLCRDQISSGTLSYAAGMGRAVVSTGYWYAQDLLGDGRGRLVEFNSPRALADAVIDLIEHPEERREIGRRAWRHCRSMTWKNVGSDYISLFREL